MSIPHGVILAGGLARRMGGGDKGLLEVGGATILDRVIERMEPQVAELALNANGDAARFSGLGLPVVPDSVEGFAGPLAGILAGLEWAAGQGAEQVVTAAWDTPFLPFDLVSRLMSVHGTIAIARTPDGAQPTFGLWPVSLRDDLRAALLSGTRKILAYTDLHGTAFAEFPETHPAPFFNVNTPEDLIEAERFV